MKFTLDIPAFRRLPLALLLAIGPMATATAQKTEAPPVFSSVKLSYAERLNVWSRLINGPNAAEGLAVGESLVEDAAAPDHKVWIPSRLANYYVNAGNFVRASQLVERAGAAMEARDFRWMAEGNADGYKKFLAMSHYFRVKCYMDAQLHKHKEAQVACVEGVRTAERAKGLARIAGRSQASADTELVVAHGERAIAERLAGRPYDASRTLAAAMEVAGTSSVSADAVALIHRVAAGIAINTGDFGKAIDYAKRSITDTDLARYQLRGRVLLQDALVMSSQWSEANAEFDAVDQFAKADPFHVRISQNLLTRALAYAHADRLPPLSADLEREWKDWASRLGAEHPLTALREGMLGAALSLNPEQGAQAAERLRHATEVLLHGQGTLDIGLERGMNLRLIAYVLERYLDFCAQRVDATNACGDQLMFQAADSLYSSRVQGAIQDAAVRATASSEQLGQLIREDQDLRNEERTLQSFIIGQTAEPDPRSLQDVVQQMRRRLDEIARLRVGLQAQIAKAFPEYAELVRPKPPTPAAIAAQLGERDLFVLLLPTQKGVHLWAIGRGGSRHVWRPMNTAELQAQVVRLRKSLELDPASGIPKGFATQEAHEIYKALLQPLAEVSAGAAHLILAPASFLQQIPFAALLREEWKGQDMAAAPWLGGNAGISHVPSASSWLAVQLFAKQGRASEPLLGWGDPLFDKAKNQAGQARRVLASKGALSETMGLGRPIVRGAAQYARIPALPETRDELLAIAKTLGAEPARDLLLGEGATRESVLNLSKKGTIKTRRVVAFATHGLMAGDLPNLLQPALALSVTGAEDTNPLAALLTLEDVLSLQLNADWVVLSACNTAAGDTNGNEALSGLARGFLYAGARSLLVTQWAVETESAKLLTTEAFAHYMAHPQASKAESLRQSMLKVMKQPAYAHPAYWAPFVLVGDGAR